MGHKRKSESLSLVKIILNAALLLPTLYNLVGKVFTLAAYEARLARKSLIKIIIIAIISGIVLASTWLCLLAAYGLYLISIGLSYTLTLLVIILINILILAILGIIIKDAEKNLLFRATRSQIRQAFKNREKE
jgi:flagellar biosynthesis protein FlhB